MKSTLKIALGQSNEPVINMMAVSTDDIRDQLCRQWIERLGGDSNLAYVQFGRQEKDLSGDYSCSIEISPLGPKAHILNHGLISDIYHSLSKGKEHISMITGSDSIRFDDTLNKKMSPILLREDLRLLSVVDLVNVITENFNSIAGIPTRTLGEFATKLSDASLPSKYQIEDSISTEDIFDGEVVAVKFTIGKVYYDILDKLSGKVIENVDSSLVTTSSAPTPVSNS